MKNTGKLCPLGWLGSGIVFTLLLSSAVSAQNLPGSADSSRIDLPDQPNIQTQPPDSFRIPEYKSDISVPDVAKTTSVTLNKIIISGATAFSEDTLRDIYAPYLNQDVPLSSLWFIAGQITQLYKNEGYFLSRAYVPAQEIQDGIATINVFEGHIADVVVDDPILAQSRIIQKLTQRILAQKPLSAYDLESLILELNTLPGQDLRAFIEPIENAESGLTRLTLKSEAKAGKGVVSVDNFGSRFLGPHQVMLSYENSFLPQQLTALSAFVSVPLDELKYASIRHAVPIYPDWKVEVQADYVTAKPGHTLKPNDIQSDSTGMELELFWQPVRQRRENLIVSLQLTGKNTNGDILGDNPLTRDRIRALRASVNYDFSDGWNGYNFVSLGLDQGLKIFGASEQGDAFISRAQADWDFTVAKLNYTRQQLISEDFFAIGRVSGQVASNPLFSSEEFGYGGQSFGRAFDSSEITGDHGLAASVEVRYLGFKPWNELTPTPYVFYDIGKVWNEDTGGTNESGSSAGMGFYFSHSSGLTANLGVAWAINRKISNPIYNNNQDLRALFQMRYDF